MRSPGNPSHGRHVKANDIRVAVFETSTDFSNRVTGFLIHNGTNNSSISVAHSMANIYRRQSSQTQPAHARFSTYSGAPSIHPSLAPTFETDASNRSSARAAAPKHSQNEKAFYSQDPAVAASSSTLNSQSDPKAADIKSWSKGFERMQDERLDKQRYVMSGNKSDEVSKLALGAKLERALGRRLSGQDATFSVKRDARGEKALEVEAH